MMTPPLSICARPALTAKVPTTGSFVFPFSCLPLTGVFVSELIVRFSFALIRPPLPCPSVPNANSALISFGAHTACAPVLETSSLTPLRRYIVGMNHSFTKISVVSTPSRRHPSRRTSSWKGSAGAQRRAQPAPTRVRMRPPHHTVLRASLAPSSIAYLIPGGASLARLSYCCLCLLHGSYCAAGANIMPPESNGSSSTRLPSDIR